MELINVVKPKSKRPRSNMLLIAQALLFIGIIILIFFVVDAYLDGYTIIGKGKIDFGVTGEFGDFVAGVVGTVFALAGTILIYLSFAEQNKQNKREAFEATFFEMVRLNSENVSQLKYEKPNGGKLEIAENRRVFAFITREFLECYKEVKRFSNSKNADDYILKSHQKPLLKIKERVNPRIDIISMAIIDIA